LETRPGKLILYRKENEINDKDRSLVSFLNKESPEIETCYHLFQRFREMLENKEGDRLSKWVEDAMATSIKGTLQFWPGSLARLFSCSKSCKPSMEYGQVGGQVNKLKTLKRQMFGRASFNLLRKRLVCDTG
jgi:transposase